MLTMNDINLKNQRVILREDLNVPVKAGHITNDARIHAALPTIQQAREAGAKVLVLSHLGRPTEGQFSEAFSLQPIADRLSTLLGQKVRLVVDWLDGVEIAAGEVVLAENVRFILGEKNNDSALAKRMAAQCDVFVMDAFATAHRAQASTVGIAEYAALACAGPLLTKELTALANAVAEPKQPLLAIVGGAKVSTKLELLTNLIEKVDQLIVGGGIANTFIAAAGFNVGKSLFESGLVDAAKKIMVRAKQRGVSLPIPIDVIVAKELSETAQATIKTIDAVANDELILDIGPKTAEQYASITQAAKTIVWNGPVGVFEIPQFAHGTDALAKAIAASDAFSLAGGGDTIAAIDQFNVRQHISYISTGGGAFLEFLGGKTLAAVAILTKRQATNSTV